VKSITGGSGGDLLRGSLRLRDDLADLSPLFGRYRLQIAYTCSSVETLMLMRRAGSGFRERFGGHLPDDRQLLPRGDDLLQSSSASCRPGRPGRRSFPELDLPGLAVHPPHRLAAELPSPIWNRSSVGCQARSACSITSHSRSNFSLSSGWTDPRSRNRARPGSRRGSGQGRVMEEDPALLDDQDADGGVFHQRPETVLALRTASFASAARARLRRGRPPARASR